MKKQGFSLFTNAALLGFTVAGAASSAARASEPPRGCFRSVAEAVAQTHAVDPELVRPAPLGFRLEEFHRDALLDKGWATVRSCDHPERPAVTVASSAAPNSPRLEAFGQAGTRQSAAVAPAPRVMQAGSLVRVVRSEGNLRFDTTAIAQASGAVGERVRVRLMRAAGEAELFVTGTIRSGEVVDLEP